MAIFGHEARIVWRQSDNVTLTVAANRNGLRLPLHGGVTVIEFPTLVLALPVYGVQSKEYGEYLIKEILIFICYLA